MIGQSLKFENSSVALEILQELEKYRRFPKDERICQIGSCENCRNKYLHKIDKAISERRIITFILPAFPGKSPNPEKVLGYLPDYAEILSLSFFKSLNEEIKKIYDPGAKIILCSDGRVFSDVVGIKEDHIGEYQLAMETLIRDMAISDISTLHLDDIYEESDFTKMREGLLENYGYSLDFLKHKVKKGSGSNCKLEEKEANRMYKGITRFSI